MHAEHLLVHFTKRRAVIGGQSREGFTLLHTEGVQREGFFKGRVQEIRVSADRRDGGQAIGQIKSIGFVQGEQEGERAPAASSVISLAVSINSLRFC